MRDAGPSVRSWHETVMLQQPPHVRYARKAFYRCKMRVTVQHPATGARGFG